MNAKKETMEDASIFAITPRAVIFALAKRATKWLYTSPRFAPMWTNASTKTEAAHISA